MFLYCEEPQRSFWCSNWPNINIEFKIHCIRYIIITRLKRGFFFSKDAPVRFHKRITDHINICNLKFQLNAPLRTSNMHAPQNNKKPRRA